MAAAMDQRRRNLLRKELAWLRRGPPARTSKPKFRIEAATALIADEPPPRDGVELARLAAARLGKTVIDLTDVTGDCRPAARLLDHVSWQLGPGDRVGIVGVNGTGKTTLLRLLAGTLPVPSLTARCESAAGDDGQHRAARLPDPGAGACRPGPARARGSGADPRHCGRSASASCRSASCWIGSACAATGSGRASASCPAASAGGSSCCSCCWPSRTCCCSTSRPTTWTSRR